MVVVESSSRSLSSGAHSRDPLAPRNDEKDPNSGPPDHRRREVFERRRAKLLHRGARLGAQDSKNTLDPWLSEGAESPEIGPADTHRLRAERQCLDDVAAAAKAAVDQDWHATADRLDDFRQHVDGRADAVFHTSTVVRDHDRIDP